MRGMMHCFGDLGMKITIAALLGIVLFAVITPAFAQEAEHHHHHHRGPSSLVVVDSTGKTVGPYVLDGGRDYVLLQTNDAQGTIVEMYIAPSQGFLELTDVLYYADADCSGTPYLPIPNSSLSPPTNPGYFVVPFNSYAFFGGVLYYPATGATPHSFSSLFQRTPGTATCSTAGTPVTFFAPAASVDLSTRGFVPPFRIVLK